MANERTTWRDAFKMADQVLYMGVRGVTDLMMVHGLVNLDFADIRTVMAEMGKAMMGTGEAEGENRAIRAAEAAINNPLLEDTSMSGARGLLINITGGEDLTLFEVDQAANRIREEVDEEANVIFGSAVDETLAGRIRVSVVATGIEFAQDGGTAAAEAGSGWRRWRRPAPQPILVRQPGQAARHRGSCRMWCKRVRAGRCGRSRRSPSLAALSGGGGAGCGSAAAGAAGAAVAGGATGGEGEFVRRVAAADGDAGAGAECGAGRRLVRACSIR